MPRLPFPPCILPLVMLFSLGDRAFAQADTSVKELGMFSGIKLTGKRTGYSLGSECVLIGVRNTASAKQRIEFRINTQQRSGMTSHKDGWVQLEPGEFKGGGIFLGDDSSLDLCVFDSPISTWKITNIRVTNQSARESAEDAARVAKERRRRQELETLQREQQQSRARQIADAQRESARLAAASEAARQKREEEQRLRAIQAAQQGSQNAIADGLSAIAGIIQERTAESAVREQARAARAEEYFTYAGERSARAARERTAGERAEMTLNPRTVALNVDGVSVGSATRIMAATCADHLGRGSGHGALALSPDGRLVAAPNPQGICIYDLAAGEQTHDLYIEDSRRPTGRLEGNFSGLVFLDDRTLIATCARCRRDKSALVRFDLATGRRHQIDSPFPFGQGTFSASESKGLAILPARVWNSWEAARVVNLSNGRVLLSFPAGPAQRAMSSNGSRIVEARFSQEQGKGFVWERRLEVRVLDARSGAVQWTAPAADMVAVAPDGDLVAIGANPTVISNEESTISNEAPTLSLWSATTGQELWKKTPRDFVMSAVFSPNQATLAVAHELDVALYRVSDGQLLGYLYRYDRSAPDEADVFTCQAIAFSSTQQLVGCYDFGSGGVRVWRLDIQ